MFTSRFYFVLAFFLSLTLSNTVTAQLSKTHYLPPITSDELVENQYIYISTPKITNVSFRIIPVGQPSSEIITGSVSNGMPFSTTSLDIGNQLYQNQNQTSSIITNKGYIIEADNVIYVSVRMNSAPTARGDQNQAASIVSKGLSAKGTEFRMGGFANDNPRDGHLNFISVMATEDNTNVTFDDFTSGIAIDNVPLTGANLTINLDKYESYIISVSTDLGGDPNDLLGTLVQSNKEVVVNSGSATGSFFGGSNTRDYGMDQIVGADKIGKEYIFVKGDGENDWENILIVAHYNNTSIRVNGENILDNSGSTKVLNKGEWHVIEGENYTDGNMYVATNEDVFAYQGVGFGNNAANQGMFFVPPLNCESTGSVDQIPNIREIGNRIFDQGGVSIVTKQGARLVIDDDASSSFSIVGPNSVTGNNNYVTYKVTGLTGNITVKSLITNSSGIEVPTELYCSYFNRNGAATSGGFYSGFPSSPEVNFDVNISTLGNCIGNNLELRGANTELFDNLEWFVFDDTLDTFVTTNVLGSRYTPTVPGTYHLKGTISCSGSIFTSTDIVVSICPDDYDGDGIIDNTDNDIDNDGILNCDESLGNVTVDLSNINSAAAVHPLNSSNIVSSSVYTSTETANSLTGNTSGNFTSTINAVANSSGKYDLTFNQNINFVFKQKNSEDHIISNGEYFILKIGPNSKNITLLDPDDQLLINTSFDLDQNFSAGIINFSASEIWFKYKENITAGSSTFQFVANQVNQITFEHKSIGLSASSTFNGNIEITCFTRDSDGDGIEDMLDLDSDNDGIPDFFESTAQEVTLTGVDLNSDGLDDIFNTATPNQDTDGDGVPNYLDIDSDNDGIYDIVEAGYGNLDANNDGFIDGANATNVGVNGLFNGLETSVDSNILDTPIRNSDSSSLIPENRDTFLDFADLDADGDDCFDVIEAGFTGNGLGQLAPNPLDVNANGKVNNSDGYTTPNPKYINSTAIVITKFEDTTFCEEDTKDLEIETNADRLQWQLSSDNGTNFTNITENQTENGTVFSNVTSKKLRLTSTNINLNNYQFRVILEKDNNICEKITPSITLTVNTKPVVLNNIVQLNQCADNAAEITTVNLTEAEIRISTDPTFTFEYYETLAKAEAGGTANQVADKKTYPVNRTASAWVRTVSPENCYTISRINITASFAGSFIYDSTFRECDDIFDDNGNDSNTDGITTFNFSQARQEIIDNFFPTTPNIEVLFYETASDRDATINPIPDITKHRNDNDPSYAFNQTIYVKVKNRNNNDCEGIGRLFLETSVVPQFTVDGDAAAYPIIICAENIPYPLEVNSPDAANYDYIWKDKNGNTVGNQAILPISDSGEYTVTAFTRNTKICERSRTIFVLKSNFGVIDEDYITIKDDNSGDSSNLSIQIDIPVNPLINEEFQYALEDSNGNTIRALQDSNIFNNIEGGVYNVVVQNKNGCGTSELEVSVIQFPKFFTPNGDRRNDTWKIKGATSAFYATAEVLIFNRFGKLVADIKIDGRGWDGTYKGKRLPADDYWYSIQLVPIDTSKKTIQRKGHFSLLDK